MGFDKQELIKGYLRTIEQNEEKIIEYSKSCDSSKRRIRALERDLLKKRNKELRKLRNWKMNKQELIEKYKSYEGKWNAKRAELARQIFIEDLKLLDEPEKVKVPQFVADWIEEAKKSCETVVEFFGYKFSNIEMIKYLKNKERINLVARAWLDGYEVEEEERYLVKMKGIDTNFNFLNRHRNENYWIFSSKDKNTLYQTHHTRKELEEADFDWVFDCEGVEVQEVDLCH